jgi:hypothetical protein
VFVARFRTRGVIGGTDTRRLAFRRSRSGAFTRLPKFEANSGCGLLRSFRLGAPVFGRTGVSAAFTLAENASYELRRGARVLRRGQGRSGRLRITSARRGRVVLRLVVRSGGRTITTKLAAARL